MITRKTEYNQTLSYITVQIIFPVNWFWNQNKTENRSSIYDYGSAFSTLERVRVCLCLSAFWWWNKDKWLSSERAHRKLLPYINSGGGRGGWVRAVRNGGVSCGVVWHAAVPGHDTFGDRCRPSMSAAPCVCVCVCVTCFCLLCKRTLAHLVIVADFYWCAWMVLGVHT